MHHLLHCILWYGEIISFSILDEYMITLVISWRPFWILPEKLDANLRTPSNLYLFCSLFWTFSYRWHILPLQSHDSWFMNTSMPTKSVISILKVWFKCNSSTPFRRVLNGFCTNCVSWSGVTDPKRNVYDRFDWRTWNVIKTKGFFFLGGGVFSASFMRVFIGFCTNCIT